MTPSWNAGPVYWWIYLSLGLDEFKILYGDIKHVASGSRIYVIQFQISEMSLRNLRNPQLDIAFQVASFLAATKQLYEWFSPSVCLSVRLSVRPSVCHTFLTMFPSSYHHEIFRSYYQWQKWRPCKRSRSEVKGQGQGHRGHNPTLPFPDCNSSLNSRMMMKWCI